MKASNLLMFVVGAAVGAGVCYGLVAYKHSLGPFRGDLGIVAGRDPRWAQPIPNPRLRNFFKVSDALYRGAQPDKEGFAELERLGIKTVVNLRLGGSDAKMLAGTKLVPLEIPAEAWDLDDHEVVAFLKVITDPKRTPVFVHCSHGADRTGAMTAIYRVAVQGWSKDDAIAEMTQGGFGYHAIWENLPTYIRRLDIGQMQRQAGISLP